MSARPGLAILDRDGVLNLEQGYAHRPDQLVLAPGAAAAVRRLNEAGWIVAVVTNQSGVARGLYDEAQVGIFHAAIAAALAAAGAHVDAWYFCPFHPDAGIVAPPLIQEIDISVRSSAPHETWNRVDGCPESTFR